MKNLMIKSRSKRIKEVIVTTLLRNKNLVFDQLVDQLCIVFVYKFPCFVFAFWFSIKTIVGHMLTLHFISGKNIKTSSTKPQG